MALGCLSCDYVIIVPFPSSEAYKTILPNPIQTIGLTIAIDSSITAAVFLPLG